MAYQGRKVFTAGTVLTASDMNSTVDQTVMVFADASARSTAIPTPTEGMVTYLSDVNNVEYYSGSAWKDIALAQSSIRDQNGSFTLPITDAGNTVRLTSNSGTITITVPDAVFAAGDRVDFIVDGTATFTFAEGSGATVNSKNGNLTLNGQYTAATLIFSSASNSYLIGDLT